MRVQKAHGTVLIAVMLAAATLFLSLSMQEGIRRDLDEMLSRWGADILFVFLTERPMVDVLKQLEADPSIEEFAIEGGQSTFIYPDDAFYITWLEVSPNHEDVVRLPLASGRYFDASDRNVAVLGWEVKQAVFGDEDPVGHRIQGVEIVGVLAQIPEEDRVREEYNRLALKPFPASATSKWGSYPDSMRLFVRANGSVTAAEDAIRAHLPGVATLFPMSEGYAGSFYHLRILSRVLLLCGLATAITAMLLVGGLLTLSTLRRRREMGVRMAIGAARSVVLRLVISEGVLVALAGSLVGMALGALITVILEGAIYLSIEHLLLPIGAALLGLVAACVPAFSAARQVPVELLGRRGLLGTRNAGRTIRVFVVLAFAVAAGAAVLVANLAVSSYSYVDSMWGDIDERALLVEEPRKSILATHEMSLYDADIFSEVQGIELVVSYVWGSIRDEGPVPMAVMGSDEGYVDLNLFHIVEGRDLTLDDFQEGARNCLVSSWAAESRGIHLGDQIRARSIAFEVVGIFSDRDVRHELPFDVVLPQRYKSAVNGYLAEFIVRVEHGADVDTVASDIQSAFSKHYPGYADVSIVSLNGRAMEMAHFFSEANVRFAITALVLLLLAVFEANAHGRFVLAQRIRELGIRRCIGASPLQIAWSAWCESALLAILGTLLGALGIHFALGQILRWFLRLERPSIMVTLATAIVAFTLIAGLGALPVRSAMRLTPSDMLRRGKV